ncbi:insulinase family protein [Flavobacterium sp. MC2016-06]|uniref:M16 family metallopeptidase n=1 Tax=Flavobacterium sp. MC2016-06 TaxID=2676308 RepID=UPI0012BB1A29|nr:M16 family metallopeptidase [Flavobacterium sp. MC2016-06]MBU3861439.1 insulinase family protein [Flavobacterium sp. MC2016-06]
MKFIKVIILNSLLFSIGNFAVNAQSFKADQPIEKSTKIKKGVLSNGMTYYIYPTTVNKNTASYYIIQNVGSILENDKQKGLAHFLEHMAFNGTKNFPAKGVLEFLQKQGATFGKNINAYTAYDETVYNFDNIPSTDPKVIDNCLLILHDWSHSLLLTNEEIDAERNVINEEWRTRQDASSRVFNQFAPLYYNHSLYADRTPIGDMNIVQHFDYNTLKDFYKNWYRPDLQAIVVIGDVEASDIEKKIKTIFSDIPAVKNPTKRFEVAIPDHEETFFKLAVDKEIVRSNISFVIVQSKKRKDQFYSDIEHSIMQKMAVNILNNRLRALSQKSDCPFKYAQVSYSALSRTNDMFNINVGPKPNQQAEAFTIVMDEFARAGKFGFSDGEIKRSIADVSSSYENYIETEKEMSHKTVLNAVKKEFLTDEPFTDAKGEFEMVKSILKNVDSRKLQAELMAGYTSKNRTVAVTGIENEKNLTQEEAFSIIKKSENNPDLKPYVDTYSEKSLLTDVTIIPGKIVSERKDKEIGSTTFTLSNGVVVHYKFTNKNTGDVELKAESFGGYSLYEPKDLPSATMAISLAQNSGLGVFSNTDLEKLLSGKSVYAAASIGNLNETVTASAKIKDIETMMELVHLRFVKPRFDPETFAILKTNMQNTLKNKDNDIRGKMRDSLNAVVFGKNNPKIRLLDQKFINDMSLEKMQEIYKDRFSDAANFEFYIAGDVTPDVLKPLLEKYIASIQGIKRKETFKDNSIPWTAAKIDKDIFIKMTSPKSVVKIQFESDYKYNPKNCILAKMFGDILTLRFTESLREKEGGTYAAHANSYISKLPVNTAILSINFDCDASKVEHLLPVVYQEIDKMKKGGFVKEDIEKTKNNYLKEREDIKNYNGYTMTLMYNFFQDNVNIDDPASYSDIVKNLTEKDLQDFVDSFLKNAKSYEVVYKPLP